MLMVVPAFAIATALGISTILHKKVFVFLLVLGYCISIMMYGKRYFIDFPKNEVRNWGYAYKKIAPLLFSSGKNVIMERPETSPYIYLLFYSSYSPEIYRQEAKRYPISSDGFTDVAGFGRFSFRTIDWEIDSKLSNTLLVTMPPNSDEFVIVDTDK